LPEALHSHLKEYIT